MSYRAGQRPCSANSRPEPHLLLLQPPVVEHFHRTHQREWSHSGLCISLRNHFWQQLAATSVPICVVECGNTLDHARHTYSDSVVTTALLQYQNSTLVSHRLPIQNAHSPSCHPPIFVIHICKSTAFPFISTSTIPPLPIYIHITNIAHTT